MCHCTLACYLVPHRPKYLPQHPILKHTQPMIVTQCERPSFAPKYNNNKLFISKSLCFLYLLLPLQMQCHHCKNGVLSVVQILHRYYAQTIQCKSRKGRVGAW
jgi:hypothetical protein